MTKENAYEVYKIYSEISEIESLLDYLEKNPSRSWFILIDGFSNEVKIPSSFKENLKTALKLHIDGLKNRLERF